MSSCKETIHGLIKLCGFVNNDAKISSLWRGERRNVPPAPKIGKFVLEIWCYHPDVYTFRDEAHSKKYLLENCEKSQFSIETLIKKIKFS